MSRDKEKLAKETFKKMYLCGALMTAIDGKFDMSEWNTCLSFLKSHWIKEYGDSKVYFNEILTSVHSLLGNQEEINKKINILAIELCPILSYNQKNDLLHLMDQVMRADRVCTQSEKELYSHIRVILTGVPIY